MYGSNAKNATCTAYWSHVACRQRLWSAYTQKFIVRRTRTVLGARDFTVQSYGTLYPQISKFYQYLLQRLPNT